MRQQHSKFVRSDNALENLLESGLTGFVKD